METHGTKNFFPGKCVTWPGKAVKMCGGNSFRQKWHTNDTMSGREVLGVRCGANCIPRSYDRWQFFF